jgi:hypothetical protein
MTVSRPELPLSCNAGPGSEDALAQSAGEGSPFVAPDRPLPALSLYGFLSAAYAAAMSPQTNPQSSRATAATASWDFFPRPTRREYLRCRRI